MTVVTRLYLHQATNTRGPKQLPFFGTRFLLLFFFLIAFKLQQMGGHCFLKNAQEMEKSANTLTRFPLKLRAGEDHLQGHHNQQFACNECILPALIGTAECGSEGRKRRKHIS